MSDALSVKYIDSRMRGAPVLNGINGTLLAVLDALLISGWGAATATSVVIAGGVATATFPAPLGWDVGAVIAVQGATTPVALNGLSRVIANDGSQLLFATSAPDGTASGTISVKYASAGWARPFTGTDMAAYRSQDIQSAAHCLRVRDSYGKYATVTGFESMTGVNDGVGRFSRASALDGVASTWVKSGAATATAVPYLLAADSRAILLAVAPYAGDYPALTAANIFGFGDPIPLAPEGDVWATFLCSSASDGEGGVSGSLSGQSPGAYFSGIVAPRAAGGGGGIQTLSRMPASGLQDVVSGMDNSFGPGPSSVTGGVLCSRVYLAQAGGTPRAIAPGVVHIPQTLVADTFNSGDVHLGAGEFNGRGLYMAAAARFNSSAVTGGVAAIDLTGPWR